MPALTPTHLSAFISFPSPYTQSLLLLALTSTLPSLSITTTPPPPSSGADADGESLIVNVNVPQLQWADYDLLHLDHVLTSPTTHLISSYIYRKTLIRKHLLHTALTEYQAKQSYRHTQNSDQNHTTDTTQNLLGFGPGQRKGLPRGWVVDVQYADEVDELLVDELWDLGEMMRENEGVGEGRRRK